MLQSPAAWPTPSPLTSCENNSQKFDSRLVSRSKLVADETPAQFPFSLATFSFSSSSFHQSVERDRYKTDQVCQVEKANPMLISISTKEFRSPNAERKRRQREY